MEGFYNNEQKEVTIKKIAEKNYFGFNPTAGTI